MPHIQVVSRQRHSQLRWAAPHHYLFAAQDTVAPLVIAELPKAQASLPLAFVATGEGDAVQYVPVAVLGLAPGKNLFVAPDGRWLGAYIPAAYRARPFLLANTPEGSQVLCIDEEAGLPGGDAGAQGQAFFTDAGEPAPTVANMLAFLTEVQTSRTATAKMCAVLQQHGLLQPWPITVQTDTGAQPLSGLFRIDEAAFNALPAEALLEVRQAGALPLVFCQLLSMQHLPQLGQLAQAHAQAAQAAQAQAAQAAQTSVRTTAAGELDLEFLNQGGTLRFGA
ncbi:MAG: SapC family protein [Burkholderiaceae bacterium]|nr:SapC family protein [Burkholderiaceae bacterium]